jgi:MinD-like ATPase involved in chromosome partitioning or flagellar assembly
VIAVLGPATLAEAVSAAFPGELVVGAGDDSGLGGPPEEAARSAAELPLPAKITVVASGDRAVATCEAVRAADGALQGTRLVVVGTPPAAVPPTVWQGRLERFDGFYAHDVGELNQLLSAAGRASSANGRGPRPGAPEVAVWRDWLSAAPSSRRLPRSFRRGEVAKGRERDLDVRIRRVLGGGCRSIAVISPKGGVGKTLLSFLLGSVLADVRRQRIVVVDTNPDFGTLADLVGERVPATVSDLLADLPRVTDAQTLDGYLTSTETGMCILAAPQDPTEMSRLGAGGYLAVNEVLRRHSDLVVYDCGTGFLDEITQFALRHADQVALVSAPQLVTTKIMLGAIDHLEATSFDLARATLVLNMARRGDHLDRKRLREAIGGRLGGLVEVPYDERVQREIDLGRFRYSRLAARTRCAVKRMAATLVDHLPAGEAGAAEPEPVGASR